MLWSAVICDLFLQLIILPIGKITVIKTFAIGKITHLLATLPDPSENTLKKLNKLLFQFLWDNKPEKIKRHQATVV